MAIQDVGEHAEGESCGAPDPNPTVPIRPGLDGEATSAELLGSEHLGVEKRVERELDDCGDLGVMGHERWTAGHRAHEWPKLEVAHRDPDIVEHADDVNQLGLEADLLPRLAQRGRLRVDISRIDGPARQRHLAGVGAKIRVPNGERNDQAPGVVRVDDKQRGGWSGRCEGGSVEATPAHLAIGASRQEALVERNRPIGATERIGDGILPAGAGA